MRKAWKEGRNGKGRSGGGKKGGHGGRRKEWTGRVKGGEKEGKGRGMEGELFFSKKKQPLMTTNSQDKVLFFRGVPVLVLVLSRTLW